MASHRHRVLLAAALCVLVASCAGLTGLDGYAIVPCPDGCDDDGGGPVVVDGAATDVQQRDGSTTTPADGAVIDAEAGPPPDGGPDGSVPASPIYAVGNNQLWKLDPATKQLTKIANAQNCPNGLEELAMDTTGTLFATSATNGQLYRLNYTATSATCSQIGNGVFPYALTFAPAGLFGAIETLVGFSGGGDYVRVDRLTGQVSTVQANALGARKPSGDLAAHGAVGYLTATDGDCKPFDCLLQVNLLNGSSTKLGDFPTAQVYGVAHSGGKVYAFSRNGPIYVTVPSPFAIVETIVPAVQVDWSGAASINDDP